MKLKIYDIDSKEKGDIELPSVFSEDVRIDLIKRAVLAQVSKVRSPYGADPLAGKRYSAYVSKRRRDYKGMYGKGISRTPRKVLTNRGTQFYWVGAVAPNTVGGRRAHPPKASKNWVLKINRKERRLAIRSAIAATIKQDLVVARGHRLPKSYPFVIDTKFESLDKTTAVKEALVKLGFTDELARTNEKIVRAGKGTMRGRKYKRKVGPLLVVTDDCKLKFSARNIPGVDVVEVSNLNAKSLAPGTNPGRLTLFTQAAIEKLNKDKLFL